MARQVQRDLRRVRREAGGGVRAVQLPLPRNQVSGAGDEQAGPRGLQHRAGERGGAGGAVAEAGGGGTHQPQGAQVAEGTRVMSVINDDLQNSNLNVFQSFHWARQSRRLGQA